MKKQELSCDTKISWSLKKKMKKKIRLGFFNIKLFWEEVLNTPCTHPKPKPNLVQDMLLLIVLR